MKQTIFDLKNNSVETIEIITYQVVQEEVLGHRTWLE